MPAYRPVLSHVEGAIVGEKQFGFLHDFTSKQIEQNAINKC